MYNKIEQVITCGNVVMRVKCRNMNVELKVMLRWYVK